MKTVGKDKVQIWHLTAKITHNVWAKHIHILVNNEVGCLMFDSMKLEQSILESMQLRCFPSVPINIGTS